MTVQNPILKGFNPDPSICRVENDYYIATSTFEWFPGVQIHHSKDLKNWRLIKRPLDRVSQLDMRGNPNSGGVWAPQLSYHNNKFWLIYSDVKVVSGAWKDCHNYLVTCDTIDGQWSEPIYLNGSGFDPSLFHDDDGKRYLVNMVWDQRVANHSFYGIVLQEYCPAQKKLVGTPQIIFKGTEHKLTEAPHLYKLNGYYYLLTAEGGTVYSHVATIARSKSICGPYEVHPQNPLISSKHAPDNPLQKAGHASIVQAHTGDWYLVCLVGRPLQIDNAVSAAGRNEDLVVQTRGYCPLGRETAIQKLEWKNDWPYVVGGNSPSMTIEVPNIKEVKWPPDYDIKDDFDTDTLNIHFQSLRIPLSEDIATLKERTGHLRLYGRESLTSQFTQAFVARRWQSFNFDAETKVEFNPANFQQMAGLACYYNTMNWTYLHITNDEKKGRILDLMTAENGRFANPLEGNTIAVPADVKAVYIKVQVREYSYVYSYSFDGKVWNEVPVVLDTYKLSDDFVSGGGFFTGAFVGMHCIDAAGTKLHADFDFFRYDELHCN
ncbi:MAG: glycoside hydrolase family 43 protein [Defluviitaleaceae bacterium]|nr:glycoside hydrolase family 43 protein [Defluviitaleaceae bacterium]